MTQITPYPVRLPPELRQALQQLADDAGRSLQQEILLRLQASVDDTNADDADLARQMRDVKVRLAELEATVQAMRQRLDQTDD